MPQSPPARLAAALALSLLFSVVTLIYWGNVLIAILNVVTIFAALSLLVVESNEYRAWQPTSRGGRISKAYVDVFYSLRHGRGKRIVRWTLAGTILLLLVALASWTATS